MAWESRRNGKTYFYTKRRVDGRVISEYIGAGLIGDLSSNIDGRERHKRTMARLDLQELQVETQRVDRLLDAYRRELRGVVAAMLQAAGFHQHKRQWRLKRGVVMAHEYYELMKAAEKAKGKGAALEKLRDYADTHPAVFDGVSLLASTTRTEVINGCSTSEPTRIHLAGECKALARSLGIQQATPLERLLIEDVVICWVRLQGMEQTYSANFNTGGVTVTQAAYLENRLLATRRRYLKSIESLARVRGLLARVGVQINVAQNQVVANG